MREDECECAIPKLRQESDYWGAGNCGTSSGLRLCLGSILVKTTPRESVLYLLPELAWGGGPAGRLRAVAMLRFSQEQLL